jgi:hypothetical protein
MSFQSSLDGSMRDKRDPYLWSKKIDQQRRSDCDTYRTLKELTPENADRLKLRLLSMTTANRLPRSRCPKQPTPAATRLALSTRKEMPTVFP